MATRIRFNAEPHHRLLADGKEIWGGQEASVDDKVAEELADADWTDVQIIAPKSKAPDEKEK